MHIRLVTPAPPRSLSGNHTTAARWAAILRAQGHRVQVSTDYAGEAAGLMIALHAWRSAAAIERFATAFPGRPLIVALTGTDAYRFIHSDPEPTLRSIALADRLVGLHDCIAAALPLAQRDKLRVIHQSARPLERREPVRRHFRVCVAGHLREEKDPLRAAFAVRELPPDSRLEVCHYGKAHTPEWAAQAQAEMAQNPRYHWFGEVAHHRLREAYTRAHLLVLSSRMEGGANVISEAVMAGLPVIASHISGSIGLLGEDHPGYYPTADTAALRELLLRAESDPGYYQRLRQSCAARRALFDVQREHDSWRKLLTELTAENT